MFTGIERFTPSTVGTILWLQSYSSDKIVRSAHNVRPANRQIP